MRLWRNRHLQNRLSTKKASRRQTPTQEANDESLGFVAFNRPLSREIILFANMSILTMIQDSPQDFFCFVNGLINFTKDTAPNKIFGKSKQWRVTAGLQCFLQLLDKSKKKD